MLFFYLQQQSSELRPLSHRSHLHARLPGVPVNTCGPAALLMPCLQPWASHVHSTVHIYKNRESVLVFRVRSHRPKLGCWLVIQVQFKTGLRDCTPSGFRSVCCPDPVRRCHLPGSHDISIPGQWLGNLPSWFLDAPEPGGCSLLSQSGGDLLGSSLCG